MTYTIDNGNPTPLSTGDRWTAIHDGDLFCSPACGHKCTRAAFDKATAGAAALVASLGEGWMPKVWENGGWYFHATKGTATVNYCEGDGDFQAEICANHSNGKSQQFFGCGSTPRAAMEDALASVQAVISTLTRTALSASLEPLAIAGD